MSKKIDDGGFVIEIPADLKLGFPLDGILAKAVYELNKFDGDKDGKRDVAEYAPFIFKGIAIAQKLAPFFDPGRARNFILGSGLIKADCKKDAGIVLDELLGVIDEAKTVAEAKKA